MNNDEIVVTTTEEKIMIYFNNNYNCYAAVTDERVIPAMTRNAVIEMFKKLKDQ